MTPPVTDTDTTRLSLRDEARLAEVAGLLHASIQATPDDQPVQRHYLARALAEVDATRGRCTAVTMARTHIAGEVPRQ
ncbi:hypothetical protein [Streptomonospora salina]|uniref:Uncharacterized protein n=1 Tax=Streptomonospora salina TaxID=104205 RepID=A0A841E3Y9_9ACTN|nr:hypothetical protein [Streptomonospora salina]MBB5998567.1 hypothetical protein [Streptomonospora salina]